MSRMTQRDRVEQYMADFGSISSLEAFRELGVTRLADVIFKMKKDGVAIITRTEKSTNRYGEPVYYARYSYDLSVPGRLNKEGQYDNEV